MVNEPAEGRHSEPFETFEDEYPGPAINIDPPEVRCRMCGGKCRVCKDPIYKRGARIIECAGKDQPYPFQRSGPCSWSSMNPGRIDPPWYWKLRVRLGR